MWNVPPPRWALACSALWLLQVGLLMGEVYWFDGAGLSSLWWWTAAMLCTCMAWCFLLGKHWMRAWSWKPRRGMRLSPELREERRRIARELHDHVGAQLLTTMLWAESHYGSDSHLHRELERCMLDLHLIVDSMALIDDRLDERLARMRHRFQPLFEQRGMQLHWQVEMGASALVPSGWRAHEVFSIVQQALLNALQHAQAAQVTVQAHYQPQAKRWRFAVVDNGAGMPQAAQGNASALAGHGMAAMRERAQRLGGAWQCVSVPGQGTSVQLELPDVRGVPVKESHHL